MISKSLSKYLIPNPADLLWGITVTAIGMQVISPGENYPPQSHPTRYLFSPEKGRTLEEYQFIYISEGCGWFRSSSTESEVAVKKGDLIIVFPGEWHSYAPEDRTGWTEQWIGCSGEIPNLWASRGIISKSDPVLHPGIHASIIQIYDRASEYADTLRPDYQKALSGAAMDIIGLALYFDRRNDFSGNDASALMDRAKEMIFSESAKTNPGEIAARLNISYSRFRKLFKSYFGISPGQYILQIKIANAKELLTNSEQQVQEIAWKTGFENSDYFVAAFKRVTGISPGTYRKKTRGM